MSTRTCAVAGRFYPGERAELRQLVDQLLVGPPPARALAVMAPHAGYVFSGKTAGTVFAQVDVPDRVVVLCPNHTGLGKPLSVWAEGCWETPLGPIPVDGELAHRLIAREPRFEADHAAHLHEHAIEVELPFLLARNPAVRLTPIVVGRVSKATLIQAGEALADVIRDTGEPVLIVSSSDMSHFISVDEARRLDRLALDRVEGLDPGGLYDIVDEHRISMCGVMPTTIALVAANALGARAARVVDYTHSGQVTGDQESVVAYAGAVIA